MAGGQRPTAQLYEHLLFGSVTEANLQALLHRLRGLCDGATEGGIEFCDREITYKIGPYITRKPLTGVRCTSRALNFLEATGVGASKVRVRQSLDVPDAPWSV